MPVSYVVVEEASDTVAVGIVIRQDPEPGTYDPNDDIVITVYVSSGPEDGGEVEPPSVGDGTVNLAVYLGGRSTMRRNRRRYM